MHESIDIAHSIFLAIAPAVIPDEVVCGGEIKPEQKKNNGERTSWLHILKIPSSESSVSDVECKM